MDSRHCPLYWSQTKPPHPGFVRVRPLQPSKPPMPLERDRRWPGFLSSCAIRTKPDLFQAVMAQREKGGAREQERKTTLICGQPRTIPLPWCRVLGTNCIKAATSPDSRHLEARATRQAHHDITLEAGGKLISQTLTRRS